MKNALILILVLVVIIIAFAKLKHDYSTFYKSKTNPLGKLTMIENHLLSESFSKISDQPGFIREFGIPCRLITYEDIETRGSVYDHDLVVLLVDDVLKVRGIIGDFVPRVTIAPEIGPTEKLITRFWKFIDREDPAVEMNQADPRELLPEERFEYKVANPTLEAQWLRWRDHDRVYILTGIKEKEAELKRNINHYLSMISEKKLLAAEYADLRSKRSTIDKRNELWKIERRLKRIYEKGKRLRSEIKELEAVYPREVVTAIAGDLDFRSIVTMKSGEDEGGSEETANFGHNAEDEVYSPLDSFKHSK